MTSNENCGPIYWEDAVPIPTQAKPGKDGLAAYFSAQYIAHAKVFQDAITGHIEAPDESARTLAVKRIREACRHHLPVMHAAFAAAASLQGWSPADIWSCIADGDGGTQEEFTWEWLFEVVDVTTDGDERAFYDRITHERPAPAPAPEGQYALTLTTAKGHVL